MTGVMAGAQQRPTTVLGIECSAQAKNLGCALAQVSHGESQVEQLASERELIKQHRGSGRAASLSATLREWAETYPRALVSIDAPPGWPGPLSIALSEHRAGQRLFEVPPKHDPFRRLTDRLVYKRLGLTPLSVGADPVARTAKRALELVAPFGELAWSPEFEARAAARSRSTRLRL